MPKNGARSTEHNTNQAYNERNTKGAREEGLNDPARRPHRGFRHFLLRANALA